MKKLFFFIASLASTAAIAQTNTFTGASGTDWNLSSNWTLNSVPTAINDVVIPSGTTVNVSNPAFAKSLQLPGTSVLVLQSELAVTETTSIASTATLTWISGNLTGGGTINNLGSINVVPFGGKELKGNTTLNNSGTIAISTDWSINVTNGTLNNLASGIIDMQFVYADLYGTGTGTHSLNNAGLIKKTGSNNAGIYLDMINTGTISVEGGTLKLNDSQIVLNGGTYNVSAGANMEWLDTIQISGSIAGNIAGSVNWAGTVNVPVAASFDFTGSGTFNWGNGHLGGGGTLTNNGLLEMTGAYFGVKYIDDLTTFNNSGIIRMSTDWIFTVANGTLNNLASGTIEFTTAQNAIGKGTLAGLHAFNNAGLVRKYGISYAIINADLNNTGTISVEANYLDIASEGAAFNSGTYHVSTGCQLRLLNTVECSGTLTGSLDGSIDWIGDISVTSSANFNFTGNSGVYWGSGQLKGGGQLNNNGKLYQTYGGAKTITENTTLNNSATFNITHDSGLTIANGTLNNLASGVVDITTACDINAGSGTHAFNNAGLLKKSASTGTTHINTITTNTGTIDCSAGELDFSNLNNTAAGTISGIWHIGLPASPNFTNNGTISPGGSPGQLVLIGNYTSTSLTHLAVELNGLTQTIEYDHLAIWGNAVLNGTVDVTLNFNANIGDQFVIADTTGTITAFAMTTTTTAIYNGTAYTFNVTTVTDNKLVLTLAQKTLAAASFEYSDQISLAPNPATDILFLKNESNVKLTDAVITDSTGRIIKRFDLKDLSVNEIHVDDFASGQYFLKLNADGKSLVKRFIVK